MAQLTVMERFVISDLQPERFTSPDLFRLGKPAGYFTYTSQRTLDRLVKLGLIRKRTKVGQTWYSLVGYDYDAPIGPEPEAPPVDPPQPPTITDTHSSKCCSRWRGVGRKGDIPACVTAPRKPRCGDSKNQALHPGDKARHVGFGKHAGTVVNVHDKYVTWQQNGTQFPRSVWGRHLIREVENG